MNFEAILHIVNIVFAKYLHTKVTFLVENTRMGKFFSGALLAPLIYISIVTLSGIFLEPSFYSENYLVGFFLRDLIFYSNMNCFLTVLGISFLDITGRYIFSLPSIHPVREIIEIFQKFIFNMENNKSWDITYSGFSFKTLRRATPILNQEDLERLAPLRSLAHNNVSECLTKQDTKDFKCDVCLGKLVKTQLHRQLPCNHVFHSHCVDNWFYGSDSRCPKCFKPLIEI